MSYKQGETVYGNAMSRFGWAIASDANVNEPDCRVYNVNGRGGKLYDTDVLSGGVLNNTVVAAHESGSYGYIEDIRISNGGTVIVRSAGNVGSDITIYGGTLYVQSGGTVKEITQNGGGINIDSDVTIEDVTFNGGTFNVTAGATVKNLYKIGATNITLYTGATVDGGEMYAGQLQALSNVSATSNATIKNYIVYGGLMIVRGATNVADTIQVSQGGTLHVQGGASGLNVDVYDGGVLALQNQTSVYVSAIRVHEGGYINGGNNGHTYVDVTVDEGATWKLGNNFTLMGDIAFNEGALINDPEATAADGVIYDLHLNSTARIASGVTVSRFTLTGGALHVSAGGVASDTILSGGSMFVSNGGTAESTTVNSGGSMVVSLGGTLKGSLQIDYGAVVSALSGATIDFTVAGQEDADTALINHYDYLQGAADATYTITVNAEQAYGQYALADFASGFDQTITVNTTAGTTLGSLTVGDYFKSGTPIYRLLLEDSTLVLSIAPDTTPPTITISADITVPTRDNVTVSAEFVDETELAQSLYRIGSAGEWLDYTGPVLVTENATVYFKAVDTSDNETEKQYAVSNIDRTAPTITDVTPSATEWTNQDVTVTAAFSDNAALASQEYRIGDGEWTAYTSGAVVSSNATVEFRAVDSAGNSATASLEISNIDKMNPEITDVTPSATEWTNGNVTVTAAFSDNVALASQEYRIGDGEWTAYTSGAVVTSNATVEFRAIDSAGNSATASLEISNIDKTNPEITDVTPSTTEWTNGNVSVTAAFSDNAALASQEYRIGDGEWTAYTSGAIVTSNATVEFRVIDSAGNSATASYEVTNIDKTAPTITNIQADITTLTQGNVTVSAVFADETELAQFLYRIGSAGEWLDYTGPVLVTENATVYFKAIDASYNETEEQYTVQNILSAVAYMDSAGNVISTADCMSGVEVTSGNSLMVYEGGSVVSTTVNTNGELHVSSGGTAACTTVYGGSVYVSSGGTAASTTVDTEGKLHVSSGGTAESTTVNYMGSVYVSSGGTAASTTVNSGGSVYVSSGGTAASTTVNIGGFVFVSSGGTALSIVENGGYVGVYGGEEVTFVPNVFIGGALGYQMTVHSGTTAVSTTVNRPGILDVLIGGTTVSTTVNSGGFVSVFSGGTAASTIVNSGGYVSVFSSGTLKGSLQIASGAVVSLDSRATIDFTVAEQEDADTALINHFDYLYHAENATYTITVNEDQAKGRYALADYASGFAQTITVNTTSGTNLGDLAVGDSFECGTAIYSLLLDDSTLVLSITSSGTTPLTITISASVTAPTRDNVTVSAVFADEIELEQFLYRIGSDGEWLDYTGPVLVTENATVYFKAIDANENETEVQYEVSNIDRTAPTITDVTPSTSAWTNQDVIVTAAFSDNAALSSKEYRIGDGEWTAYTSGAVVTSNATVEFRAIDSAGNSATASLEISNIDKTNPEITDVTPSTSAWTNGNVSVTAAFSDNAALSSKEYRIGEGEWTAYTSGAVVSSNGTMEFRAIDSAGNSATASLEISNIDKTNLEIDTDPEINIAYSTKERTNGLITLTVTADRELAKVEYTLTNGREWIEVKKTEGSFSFTRNYNGSFDVRGTDLFGNVGIARASVWNVDRSGPERPTVTASTTAPTNQNVILTAAWSADSVEATREYSFDKVTWTAYTGPVEIKSNCSVYFRSADDLGNVGYDRKYNVTNIDKVAPNAPKATASTTKATSQDVTVKANKAYGVALLEFSTDGLAWSEYAGPIVFSENGSVQFRATDAAGNVSAITTYNVSNIDKEAPDAPEVTASVTTPTKSSVRLNATWPTDAYRKQFSLDGGNTWNAYNGYVLVKKNTLVQFRTIDKAGNVSDIVEKNVNNIFQLVNGTNGNDVMTPSTDLDDFRNGRQDWLQGRNGNDVYLFGASDWGSAYVSDTADSLLVFDEQRRDGFTLSNDPLTGNTVALFDGIGEDYSVIYFDRIISEDQIYFADVSSLAGKTANEIRNALLA